MRRRRRGFSFQRRRFRPFFALRYRIYFGTLTALELTPLPLLFWRSPGGREPVRDWLRALDVDDKKIVGRDIAKVQYRWPVGLPLCRSLGEGLWEVRTSLPGRREVRILFGFAGGVLVALHAFFKKSQAAPDAELRLARERWRDLK